MIPEKDGSVTRQCIIDHRPMLAMARSIINKVYL